MWNRAANQQRAVREERRRRLAGQQESLIDDLRQTLRRQLEVSEAIDRCEDDRNKLESEADEIRRRQLETLEQFRAAKDELLLLIRGSRPIPFEDDEDYSSDENLFDANLFDANLFDWVGVEVEEFTGDFLFIDGWEQTIEEKSRMINEYHQKITNNSADIARKQARLSSRTVNCRDEEIAINFEKIERLKQEVAELRDAARDMANKE